MNVQLDRNGRPMVGGLLRFVKKAASYTPAGLLVRGTAKAGKATGIFRKATPRPRNVRVIKKADLLKMLAENEKKTVSAQVGVDVPFLKYDHVGEDVITFPFVDDSGSVGAEVGGWLKKMWDKRPKVLKKLTGKVLLKVGLGVASIAGAAVGVTLAAPFIAKAAKFAGGLVGKAASGLKKLVGGEAPDKEEVQEIQTQLAQQGETNPEAAQLAAGLATAQAAVGKTDADAKNMIQDFETASKEAKQVANAKTIYPGTKMKPGEVYVVGTTIVKDGDSVTKGDIITTTVPVELTGDYKVKAQGFFKTKTGKIVMWTGAGLVLLSLAGGITYAVQQKKKRPAMARA